jgi:dolichol-phosphate mannosyltransferase
MGKISIHFKYIICAAVQCAYVEGFKRALDSGTDYIFEMDADLSHDPDNIPQFIEAAKDNDLIIGSRYVADGKIKNWSRLRKLISRGGTLYAKKILNLPINDLTSGYKCFRSHLLKTMDLENISSDGYSFQIELTYKAYQKGYKVKEIPIIFKDRSQGESKFSKKIFWEAVWIVWKMRFQK